MLHEPVRLHSHRKRNYEAGIFRKLDSKTVAYHIAQIDAVLFARIQPQEFLV